VSKKIEQTGEDIKLSEVNTIADNTKEEDKKKPLSVVPDLGSHLTQCMDLIKVPDLDSEHEPDIRCIYLADGRIFFGILFFETLDSFLVGASARLVMDDSKEITAEPLSPTPIIRIFKNSIVSMSQALPKYKYHYYKYLHEFGRVLLPDYIKDDNYKKISIFVEDNTSKFSGKYSEDEKPKNSVKDNLDKKGISGVSENAFTPFVTSEKIH